MKFGLEEHIVDSLISVFEEHSKVDKAIVFGSRAKGNYRPDSDIDIAIKGQELTTDDIILMAVAFEAEGITYKIDLIDYNKIKEPDLKAHVDRVGIEFYSRRKNISLKDLGCSLLSGYAFKSSDYSNFGIPLIKIGNIQNRTVTIDTQGDFVSLDQVNEKTSKYLLSKSDVLIAMTGQGSVGRVGKLKIEDGERAFLNQRVGKFICDEIHLNIDYLFYILTSDKYQDLLFNTGSGSGQPNLSPELILSTEIPWINYNEQIEIASILISLDEKIDLLHRQNKTLEQLAEALFRRWFGEGQEEGWEEKKISDIIEVRDGTHDSPKQTETGKYLITSKHLKPTGIDFSTAYKISEADFSDINKRSKVDKDDILFSMIGTLGLIHYVDTEPDFAIKNMGLFKSSQKPNFARFLFLLLKSPEGRRFVYENADGSTQEYITLSSLRNFEFKYPGEETLERFDLEVKPMFRKIETNTSQIYTLTKTRDALLPKLLNGEIRVMELNRIAS